jgi:hypothetical protein
MNNITLFNQACAVIFAKLYQEFPLPLYFDQGEIGFYERWDQSDQANLRRRILHATLIFLKEEGFITFKFQHEANALVHEARLTSKGLTKLQRIPEGIQDNSKSLIDQLLEATSTVGDKTTSTALAVTVKHFISLILG